MFQWEEDINKRIEMARLSVNQLVFAFLHDRRMPTIRHPAIKQCVPGQYLRDRVHLTDEGNDLFLESQSWSLLARCMHKYTPHSLPHACHFTNPKVILRAN